MSQKAPTGFRLDDDIDEAVRVRIARERTTMTRVANRLLRAWLENADSNMLNKDAETVTLPPPHLVPSLHALARKLAAAKADLDAVIHELQIDRENDRNGETGDETGSEFAASDAAASEQRRMVAGVLRSVAHLTGSTGASDGGAADSAASPEKAPDKTGSTRKAGRG